MRVIGGTHGGRRLRAPPGRDTRPTSDRVREALFSSLQDRIVGARALDLYAGSGALGIEALSRGAAHVTFVESDPRTAECVRRNLRDLGLEDRAVVHRQDAGRFSAKPVGGLFDVVLCDPPYAVPLRTLYEQLKALREAGALADRAVVVVERDRRDEVAADQPPSWLAFDRVRSYGDTMLLYLEACA